MSIENRYDFVLLFDVIDGNPNGDPDAGNLPRIDAETGRGLVTDVCLKRKVRNYVSLTHGYRPPYDIYVKEAAVLGRAHSEAFKALNISLGKESSVTIPEEVNEELTLVGLPDGLTTELEENGNTILIVSSDADKKDIQKWLKETQLSKAAKGILRDFVKGAQTRKPTKEETDSGRSWMCKTFYDIRTFGAVMALKSAPNCGQVRGPVQLTFARSIDPVVPMEHSITRMAVATEREAEKQSGANRTMGRKHTIPYGLYVAHGFVSSFLAKQTGFSAEDLKLLLEALSNMLEHDRSAARGEMSTRGLYVFRHDSQLGNAPAFALFSRLAVQRKDTSAVPRSFDDYGIQFDGQPVAIGEERSAGPGVTLSRIA